MIRGVLGHINGERVYGWALDDTDPTLRLVVRVCLGDQELGRAEASIPRVDLQGLLPGNDGAHGYTVELPSALTGRQLAELTAEASHPGAEEWQRLLRYRPEPSDTRQSAPRSEEAAADVGGYTSAIAAVGAIAEVDDFWTDVSEHRHIGGGDDAFPVFVIGAPRSGTSALFAALTKSTRYRGFREGHLLDIAAGLNAAIDAFIASKHRTQSSDAFAQCHVARDPYARLRIGLHALLRVAADGYTTPFWVDKTPTREMVQAVPVIAQVWENARFIYMKRRGTENLMSRLRKFPRIRFEAQCLDWATIMSDWRKVRSAVSQRFLELEQRSLLLDPVGSATKIGELIGLDAAEIEALGLGLRRERVEVTDPTATIIADIAETGWSAEMIETFRTICGPEMAAYGYTDDARYCE